MHHINKCKKNIKENVSCDSSGIHLLSIFETLGQKLEVLLSTFRSTKRNLEWIYPPLCLTRPLILNFFQPALPPPTQKQGGVRLAVSVSTDVHRHRVNVVAKMEDLVIQSRLRW